jgi:hypothetical protein
MHNYILHSGMAFDAIKNSLQTLAHNCVKVTDAQLNESIASGVGFRTRAAYLASLRQFPEKTLAEPFSCTTFVTRLAELSENSPSAEALGVLLEGATIDVTISELPEARQRAERFSDIAFDVSVKVDGISPAILTKDIRFLLPDFDKCGNEPYRIDSAYLYRADDGDYAVTRRGAGKGLMTAKLINGSWRGGAYIYAPEHQNDHSRCHKSIKMSLIRAILPALTSGVYCTIFKPDRYQEGAWRARMTVGPAIEAFLENSPLQFDLPRLHKRHFIKRHPFYVEEHIGIFQKGIWAMDLTSNGIAESENPTSVETVKQALLASVRNKLKLAGYTALTELQL